MVGVHWIVWNGWFMSSCCSDCGLGLPSFPVSPINTLLNLHHDVLISVWNHWFMTSWCNGCGVGLSSFPASPIYTLLFSLILIFSYSSFPDVYFLLLYRFALNVFPSWKRWVELKLFERWPSEKGVDSKWKTKKKTCPWLIGSRLSQRYIARFAICTYDFGTRLWRHKSSVVTKHI